MLLAVLEKKISVGVNNMDAYINVVGGLKVSETACDLSVLSAVYSAIKDRPIRPDTLVLGEVGLTGEIRPISDIERRLSEAVRLGFSSCILPGGNKAGLDRIMRRRKAGASDTDSGDEGRFPEMIFADTLAEALDVLFADQSPASRPASKIRG